MATFKALVKKEKMRKDKTWKVLIRFTHGLKVAYLPTTMYANKRDLTSSFKIKNQDILDKCDELIKVYRKKLSDLNLEINNMPFNEVVAYLKEKNTNTGLSFTAYADKWISETKIKGYRNYQSAVNALKHFLKKDDVLFSDITVNTMKAFEDYLAGKMRAQSLYTNCIVRLFNDARDYYNDEDNDIIRIKHSLKKYTSPKQNVAEKRALTLDEIISIIKLPYQNSVTRNGDVCRRDMAKDCFVLSFCLMGMNSADLYNATEYDGETITYERTKTKDRRPDNARISVRVHSFVHVLLEKYRGHSSVFNFRQRYSSAADFNRALNLGLKDISHETGISHLQFYAARHSMATIAVNNVGISKYVVNDMLNHVEPSMKITDLYIKKDFTAINEANFKLIDYVLDAMDTGTPK